MRPDSPTTRLILETVGKVASPDILELLLADALARAGNTAIPDEDVGDFVEGPLRDAIADGLGENAAAAVVSDLRPILARSGSRRSGRYSKRSGLRLSARGEKVNVVVADHQRSYRTLVGSALLEEGYNAIVSEDGHFALAACMRHRPVLVVAAMEMPTVGGLRLVELLANSRGIEPPPVILATEDTSFVELPDGVHAILYKPFAAQALLEIVDPLATARVLEGHVA